MSFVVFAIANPVDNKPPKLPQAYPTDNKQLAIDPIPLSSAPLSPSTVDLHPLNKRDTPAKQAESQKNQQTVAVPVAQKVDNTKIVDNNRKTRDTVQKNAPSVLTPSNTQPQKAVDPVKSQKVSTVPENIRKTRDTVQKNAPTVLTPSNTQPQKAVDPVKSQKVSTVSENIRKTRDTVQKNTPSNAQPQKAVDPVKSQKVSTVPENIRKTRDTVQKNTPSNTQPQKAVDPVKSQKVSTVPENIRKTRDTVQKNTPSNTQPQKAVDPVKSQKVDTLSQNIRKTRETVKTDEVKKTLTDSAQKTSSGVTNAPQVVRVPLTNSRSRRDTSNDQSKPVAANVKSETNLDNTKANAPSSTVTESKPKRDSQANNSQIQQSDNLGTTGFKRPVPVDQILRRKPATTATDA